MSDFIPRPVLSSCPPRFVSDSDSRCKLLARRTSLVARVVKCPIEVSKAYFVRTCRFAPLVPSGRVDRKKSGRERERENMRQSLTTSLTHALIESAILCIDDTVILITLSLISSGRLSKTMKSALSRVRICEGPTN